MDEKGWTLTAVAQQRVIATLELAVGFDTTVEPRRNRVKYPALVDWSVAFNDDALYTNKIMGACGFTGNEIRNVFDVKKKLRILYTEIHY